MIDIDPAHLAMMRRMQEIRELTSDHAVQQFWQWWHEHTPGRVDFTIHANVAWQSAAKKELDLGIGWIRPTPYDPPDAGPEFEIPLKGHRDYGAGVAIDAIPEGDSACAVTVLGAAAESASFLTNCLSALTGYAAWWRPARVLSCIDRSPGEATGEPLRYRRYFPMPPLEEMTSIVVTDDWMERAYAPFVRRVLSIGNPDVKRVLQTAISWQAQANSISGLARYLHYFASVELLAHFFYEHLPPERVGKRPQGELRQRVLEALIDIDSQSYMESANKISDMLEVSARTKGPRMRMSTGQRISMRGWMT